MGPSGPIGSVHSVMVFSKTTCPFCTKIKDLFKSLGAKMEVLELDQIDNGSEIQAALLEKTGQRTVPNVFINGAHIGGCDDTMKLAAEEKLLPLIANESHSFDYDIVV